MAPDADDGGAEAIPPAQAPRLGRPIHTDQTDTHRSHGAHDARHPTHCPALPCPGRRVAPWHTAFARSLAHSLTQPALGCIQIKRSKPHPSTISSPHQQQHHPPSPPPPPSALFTAHPRTLRPTRSLCSRTLSAAPTTLTGEFDHNDPPKAPLADVFSGIKHTTAAGLLKY